MKLTPKTLETIYLMLCQCKPFSSWKLPCSEEINFQVTREVDAMGSYRYDPDSDDYVHYITISKEKNGFLETAIRTMAHELIHMKRYRTERWDRHDAVFRKCAHQIAKELGFDPLEL